LKRILVISGLELWNYGPRWEVFSRFARSGYEVHYVSPFNDEACEGIYIHKIYVPLLRKMEGRLFAWFLFMIYSFKLAVEIAKKSRPHIIYGYEIFGAFPAYMLSRILRTPLVLRFQGTILYPHLGKKSLLPFFHHVFAFKIPADFLIITNDGTYGNLVAGCLKIPEKKIKFWMNGIDKYMHPTANVLLLKEKLGLPKTAKVVISICRLAGWKGVHRLIEAVPYVIKKRKDVFFVIVGDGSEKVRLKDLADKLSISDYVKFVGQIPHKDLPNYFAIGDVYVTLQDLSCLSASLMEAMVCGKCVVALNTGDTGKVLKNDENGILLNYSQLKFLPDVLLRLLEEDECRAELGRKAEEFALKNFWTWDERANEEIKLVEELIKTSEWNK